MLGRDCRAPYTDGIFIDKQAPWAISAIANYNLGWKDPVCIFCENKDEFLGYQIEIDQLPCSVTNNCPKSSGDDHSDDHDHSPSSSSASSNA